MSDNKIDSEEFNEGPNKEERMLAAICYLPFGFLAPLLMHKESNFLSFHTKQGGIIFGIYLILNILPTFFIWGILTLFYIGIAIIAINKAYNGEMFEFWFIRKILDILNGKK
ncbi:hypothetical protein M0P65_01285 [Candidatus Gracilibacteria bacterium]|nr:hypothetical protein [Candidatus Gracilibacteria bacterium]